MNSALAAILSLLPGLSYRQFDCTVAGHRMALSQLQQQPGHGLELRAMSNPGAHPDSHCREGYGGPDLEKLLNTPETTAPGFEILAATNGTLFRESRHAYVSNTLLWSKGAGLIAPLRRGGGTELFIADEKGGHGAQLSFVPCAGKDACARLSQPGDTSPASGRSLRSPEILKALQIRFPTMTLAFQSNMPLMDGHTDPQGRFTHWSRCPGSQPNDWRCRALARTVVCAQSDGSISLLTTPAALPFDLASGLRKGGECHTDCVFFYNLDGGGSTQMSRAEPARSEDGSRRYLTTGRRIETTQPGCSPYRPVDNYLLIGRPRQ